MDRNRFIGAFLSSADAKPSIQHHFVLPRDDGSKNLLLALRDVEVVQGMGHLSSYIVSLKRSTTMEMAFTPPTRS
jgi:hypothetical protein